MITLKLIVVLVAAIAWSQTAAGQSLRSRWELATKHAAWSARDSQGELVFNDQMWIFGGWVDSYKPPLRDVWTSSDGSKWRLLVSNAPWKAADLPMTVTFDGKMWLMGGWYNGRLPGASATNQVWSSADGITWIPANTNAAWSARAAAGIVSFRGKMWILGGTEDYYGTSDASLKNDVWSSTDGERWNLETAHAEWAPRAHHQAIVFDGRIFVLGGGNYSPKAKAFNDVWCTEDGIHWTQATADAAWSKRIWFSSVVYQDRIWVLGGWSDRPSQNWSDVWHSEDGKNWTELKTPQGWAARHEHSALVFKNRIWIAGGNAWPLLNDVWSLEIGAKPNRPAADL